MSELIDVPIWELDPLVRFMTEDERRAVADAFFLRHISVTLPVYRYAELLDRQRTHDQAVEARFKIHKK